MEEEEAQIIWKFSLEEWMHGGVLNLEKEYRKMDMFGNMQVSG